VPDLADVRGVSLATIHALTTAAMIVGVPVLVGRRLAARRVLSADITRGAHEVDTEVGPLAVVASATLVGAGLTIATQRAAWALVRLWLDIDDAK
jgi:hypothetical protein